jgi:hypothetical protein
VTLYTVKGVSLVMTGIDSQQETGCPPHHWLIGDAVQGVERWQCLRCGAEREQEKPHAQPHRWQSNQSGQKKAAPSEPEELNTAESSG